LKVGGQAVIDGVLMMGKKVVVAVRTQSGEIQVRELGTPSVSQKWMRIPLYVVIKTCTTLFTLV